MVGRHHRMDPFATAARDLGVSNAAVYFKVGKLRQVATESLKNNTDKIPECSPGG